jgi:hypothetical protein
LAALKVGKSFEITDYPHSQTEIAKLRGGIGGNRSARLVRFAVRRLSGTKGVRITKIGTWNINRGRFEEGYTSEKELRRISRLGKRET